MPNGSTDEFAWMRDPADPRLLANLRAEREQYDRATMHLQDLRETLFGEVERRLVPTDESVRTKRGAFFYYTRSVTGSEYEQFLRTRDRTAPGDVVLDEATLAAEPGGYVALGVREPSPDGRLLAYSVDTDGDEVYTLRYRDMRTLIDLPDISPRTYYGGAWSADAAYFFYTVHDDLYRPCQVWRHKIGTPGETDVLVFVEDDARFEVTVSSSTSGAYILITTANRDTTEVLAIPAATPQAAPAVIRPREKGIEYAADHLPAGSDQPGEGFAIVTNLGAEEFRLMRAPVQAPADWTELVPPQPGERLHACHVLAGHLVLELRRDGTPLLRVIDRASGTELTGAEFPGTELTGPQREISAAIPAGRIVLHEHNSEQEPIEYAATSVIVQIDSLVQPRQWFEVDLVTGERTLLKALDVPGYDPSAYRTERRHAPAPDGVLVPVTLAWREDTRLDGTAPCLMWGYGAYESCDDPQFDPALASLLDRGYVYALTHPRGGGENGRAWWRDGHLAAKKNTFADHLAVANWLAGAAPDATGGGGAAAVVDSALVDPARIATRGLSAGGLLQARVAAMAPRRWAAIVAEVPFVDVVGSMSDPTIPLTIAEWDEWGDPRKPEAYAWMHAYSPYDNLPASPRAPMLVTAALHDPRVLVHEPAKYVAKLRATASPDDELLFRVELGAGAHTGPSGRYAHYRYEAEIYAYVIGKLGTGTGAGTQASNERDIE